MDKIFEKLKPHRMKNDKSYCCKTTDGEDIYLFSLKNNQGTEILISNYGGIINKFIVNDLKGNEVDIVLGFDKMDDYLDKEYLTKYPYFGAIIGRYANRIENAEFKIDEKQYKVSKNNKTNQLHGGWKGFDQKIWNLIDYDETSLVMEYTSPDGEEGYPGNVNVSVRYELNDDNELSYEFTAVTDQPTAINLSHHSYFNLNGKGNILDHELRINADEFLEQDSERVATGNYIKVENSDFDFTKPAIIKSIMDLNEGIDHSYLVRQENSISLAATLSSLESGLQLEVWTTEPVVHFFAGKGLPANNGKNNETYGDYSGMCLETQVHPNAINISSFPDTILRPGETYRQKTIYKISVAEAK
jgi:aldose 1-epimerase